MNLKQARSIKKKYVKQGRTVEIMQDKKLCDTFHPVRHKFSSDYFVIDNKAGDLIAI